MTRGGDRTGIGAPRGSLSPRTMSSSALVRGLRCCVEGRSGSLTVWPSRSRVGRKAEGVARASVWRFLRRLWAAMPASVAWCCASRSGRTWCESHPRTQAHRRFRRAGRRDLWVRLWDTGAIVSEALLASVFGRADQTGAGLRFQSGELSGGAAAKLVRSPRPRGLGGRALGRVRRLLVVARARWRA